MPVLQLEPSEIVGGLTVVDREPVIPGGTCYAADSCGAGLVYRFARGALAAAEYLSADLLVDNENLVTFALTLQAGENGPAFRMSFGAVGQCQTRIRLPVEAVKQNVWRYPREGGWLKGLCGGDRVDIRRVDRMTISVAHKDESPARFCLTPVTASDEQVPKLAKPILPKGPLIDRLGQSTLHDWPQKSRTADEVTARLRRRLSEASAHHSRAHLSRWGGWKEVRFEPTGFFRTEHDGRRWWLVDPDGYAFWSSGPDCVRPDAEAPLEGLEEAFEELPDPNGPYGPAYRGHGGEDRSIYFMVVNLMRAFGVEKWRDKWAEVALGEIRRIGMNTIGNWSDWRIAREAQFPYVRPLDYPQPRTPFVFRDMPDVFHESLPDDAAEFARQLRETAEDPALLGYFLMNEPTWGFSRRSVAENMMYATPSCQSRRKLAEFLRARYGGDAGLAAAWSMDVRLSDVAEGNWEKPFSEAAAADLTEFSARMVDTLFRTLSDACRAGDPNHLNLGARYGHPPPNWALAGMSSFDVFSANCYRERVHPTYAEVSTYLQRPVLIGEWHFGALDVGLPASGLMRVRDQAARGTAFRVYLEDAAAKPWCVGAHWFTLYDQSALGRFDGENLNIGLLDICHRRYDELCDAAAVSHDRLYEVASGSATPFEEEVEYLPIVFA